MLRVGRDVSTLRGLEVSLQVKNKRTPSVRRNVPAQSAGTSMISVDSINEIAERQP